MYIEYEYIKELISALDVIGSVQLGALVVQLIGIVSFLILFLKGDRDG